MEPADRTLMAAHAAIASIAVLNADFVLVFSAIKPAWDPQRGLVAGGELEPVSTVSINPIAAKQLLRQLGHAIENFEEATKSAIPDVGDIAVVGNMNPPPQK